MWQSYSQLSINRAHFYNFVFAVTFSSKIKYHLLKKVGKFFESQEEMAPNEYKVELIIMMLVLGIHIIKNFFYLS